MILVPMHSNTSLHSSNAFLSPPTIIDKVPFLAPISPPDTGASKALISLDLASSYILIDNLGLVVVISITVLPSLALANIPLSPKYTSSTSLGYPTIVIIISLSLAHDFISSHHIAPSSITSIILDLVLVYTKTSCPALIKFFTIDFPITPTPINPIFFIITPPTLYTFFLIIDN